jgi:hypothetical protein
MAAVTRTLRTLGRPHALLALGFALLVAKNRGLLGSEIDGLIGGWLNQAMVAFAAFLCVLRSIKRADERAAWALLGAGLLAVTAGDCYLLVVSADGPPPIPSLADAGYLSL